LSLLVRGTCIGGEVRTSLHRRAVSFFRQDADERLKRCGESLALVREHRCERRAHPRLRTALCLPQETSCFRFEHQQDLTVIFFVALTLDEIETGLAIGEG